MPRVLHAAETIKGGVGAHLEEVVRRQMEAFGPDNVRVIVPEQELQYFPGIPASVVRGFVRPGPRLANTFALARAIRVAQQDWRPDLIHAHSTFAGAAVRLPRLWAARRPAIVYCPHGWSFADADSATRRAFVAAERLMERAADAIVNVSQCERDLAVAAGLDARKQHVLRNGIADMPPPEPIREGFDPSRFHLLFVGRLDRQKGFDILLDAAHRVRTAAHFHVVGSAVREGTAASPALPGNVTLYGWQPRERAVAFMAACDAVVMPSRWEGLPLVALEAMRAGKSILGSDRSAVPEVVDDGVTGRLVCIDDGSALAAAIDGLTRADLQRWGSAARARFESEFTIERQVAEMIALYDRVLAETAA